MPVSNARPVRALNGGGFGVAGCQATADNKQWTALTAKAFLVDDLPSRHRQDRFPSS